MFNLNNFYGVKEKDRVFIKDYIPSRKKWLKRKQKRKLDKKMRKLNCIKNG